jgi:hypothetical protein
MYGCHKGLSIGTVSNSFGRRDPGKSMFTFSTVSNLYCSDVQPILFRCPTYTVQMSNLYCSDVQPILFRYIHAPTHSLPLPYALILKGFPFWNPRPKWSYSGLKASGNDLGWTKSCSLPVFCSDQVYCLLVCTCRSQLGSLTFALAHVFTAYCMRHVQLLPPPSLPPLYSTI